MPTKTPSQGNQIKTLEEQSTLAEARARLIEAQARQLEARIRRIKAQAELDKLSGGKD